MCMYIQQELECLVCPGAYSLDYLSIIYFWAIWVPMGGLCLIGRSDEYNKGPKKPILTQGLRLLSIQLYNLSRLCIDRSGKSAKGCSFCPSVMPYYPIPVHAHFSDSD